MSSMGQRRRVLLLVLLLGLAAVSPAPAQNNIPGLGSIFDEYNAYAKAGDLEKMLALRTVGSQKDIREFITKPEDREYFITISRSQVPESYQTQHFSWGKNRQSAKLYLLLQLTESPAIQRPRQRLEGVVIFKKENDVWKIDSLIPLSDPEKITRPKNLVHDPENINLKVTGQVEGRIVKTEYKPAYTLVLLRVWSEEHAVFLPPKKELAKAGVQLPDLEPWKLEKFSGHPHKSDPRKFFATKGEPLEDFPPLPHPYAGLAPKS
jgi:hypothetical protein